MYAIQCNQEAFVTVIKRCEICVRLCWEGVRVCQREAGFSFACVCVCVRVSVCDTQRCISTQILAEKRNKSKMRVTVGVCVCVCGGVCVMRSLFVVVKSSTPPKKSIFGCRSVTSIRETLHLKKRFLCFTGHSSIPPFLGILHLALLPLPSSSPLSLFFLSVQFLQSFPPSLPTSFLFFLSFCIQTPLFSSTPGSSPLSLSHPCSSFILLPHHPHP